MKSKCKYCGIKIHWGNIRCSKCDCAWQDGFEDGKEAIKDKLREAVNAIRNLVIRI